LKTLNELDRKLIQIGTDDLYLFDLYRAAIGVILPLIN